MSCTDSSNMQISKLIYCIWFFNWKIHHFFISFQKSFIPKHHWGKYLKKKTTTSISPSLSCSCVWLLVSTVCFTFEKLIMWSKKSITAPVLAYTFFFALWFVLNYSLSWCQTFCQWNSDIWLQFCAQFLLNIALSAGLHSLLKQNLISIYYISLFNRFYVYSMLPF